MFGRMWEAVETKAGKIGVAKTKRRSEGGSKKETRRKDREKKNREKKRQLK